MSSIRNRLLLWIGKILDQSSVVLVFVQCPRFPVVSKITVSIILYTGQWFILYDLYSMIHTVWFFDRFWPSTLICICLSFLQANWLINGCNQICHIWFKPQNEILFSICGFIISIQAVSKMRLLMVFHTFILNDHCQNRVWKTWKIIVSKLLDSAIQNFFDKNADKSTL